MAEPLNWLAIGAGIVLGFGLGMIWFSPLLFGKTWAAGSHGLKPPDAPPFLAMGVQLLGTALLALVIGMTAAMSALGLALGIIAATACLVAGMDLFSQKTVAATLVDASYILATGALMILAQGLF